MANEALLLGDASARVHDVQAVLFDDTVVLFEHLRLKDAEALGWMRTPAHVHAGLVELQFDAASEQAIQGHVNRHAEVEREIGPDGKSVQLSDPGGIDTARGVTRKGGERVPIGQHDHARFERRNNFVEEPVSEICRVQQAERRRRERVLLLPGAACGFD